MKGPFWNTTRIEGNQLSDDEEDDDDDDNNKLREALLHALPPSPPQPPNSTMNATVSVSDIEILTSTDKPRQLPILKTSMQGNPNSNQNASQPQSYRLLDKLTNALKSKIMTRLA